MTYHQITFEERYTLGLLRQRGLSPTAIARVLGRHRSTIGREVGRNRARSDATHRPPAGRLVRAGTARAVAAQSAGHGDRVGADSDAAAGGLEPRTSGRPAPARGALVISHETIYR